MLRARFRLQGLWLVACGVLPALLLLASLLTGRIVAAQSASSFPLPVGSSADAIIGPGDLLDVRVFNVAELSGSYRVSGQGTLELPLIGKLNASGISASSLAFEIADRYRKGGFILSPQITLRILEFATQGITISGEVQRPGIYPVFGPRSVSDALALAGGITVAADTHIQVRHRSAPGVQTVELPFEGLHTAEAEAAQILPGDTIFVPRAGIIYVLGEVNRPGGISMRNSGHLTLLEALSEAQGAKHTAKPQQTIILRKTGETYNRVPVRLGDYMKGRQGDVELLAGDVIVVPSNEARILLQETSALIGTLGSAILYAGIH